MGKPGSFAIALRGRRSLLYLLFWVLVAAIFLYDSRYMIYKASLPYFLVCGSVRLAMLVLMAWINLDVLLPRFLLRRMYVAYIAAALGMIASYLLAQSLFDYYLYGFIVGPYRHGSLSGTLAYSFTHTFLYLGLTLALRLSIDWYEKARQLSEIRVQQLESELNYLRSQVNPHFFFNALNNLYALTIQRSDRAPEVVLKLSGLMEYLLYGTDEKLVPLEKEVDSLRNYLDLEKLRYDEGADIRLEITGAANRCLVPPFLLLPLVENAFKHGVSRQTQGPWLHIRISADDTLQIDVCNSKPPRPGSRSPGGIGLPNIRRRLELLYPSGFGMAIRDRADSFEVSIQLPQAC